MNKKHQTEEMASENYRTAVPVSSQLVVLATILLVIFGSGIFATISRKTQLPATLPLNVANTEKIPEVNPIETIASISFDEISIAAEAAFVWDVKEQRTLFQKNADKQLPLASITKLMTALLAHELLEKDASILISLAAIVQDGESGLVDGEAFTLDTLTDLTLMNSSNDGAFAIATVAGEVLDKENPTRTFINAMNIRAEEIGLTQTYFKNPTGLDISETEAGAYGSARDVAFLMEYIMQTQSHILERTTTTKAQLPNKNGVTHTTQNTNQSLAQIPGILGSKTGYTTLAGGNLVVAFDASFDHPIITVILHSSRSGRFTDSITLSDAARNTIK